MDELHEKVKLHYETICQKQEADEKAHKTGEDAQENINTEETTKEEKKLIGKETPISFRSAGSDEIGETDNIAYVQGRSSKGQRSRQLSPTPVARSVSRIWTISMKKREDLIVLTIKSSRLRKARLDAMIPVSNRGVQAAYVQGRSSQGQRSRQLSPTPVARSVSRIWTISMKKR
eukprot:symbB.v1.2.011916.t1/scaffold794.1/size161992/9